MQTEAEIFTGHTNIERIVTRRHAALALIERLIQQLNDISTLTRSIGDNCSGLCNEAGFPL
ncbi:hypothetical protein L390_01775 [Klebsiella quasipneumoniae subsp. similipneumoniae]|nr:hypothetical protein L390_01775 [Klebsiella quasipneumoniae subsp. similipneumoniae]KDL58504.1 hypothetical protein AD94_03098 [Klebsiella variicola]